MVRLKVTFDAMIYLVKICADKWSSFVVGWLVLQDRLVFCALLSSIVTLC